MERMILCCRSLLRMITTTDSLHQEHGSRYNLEGIRLTGGMYYGSRKEFHNMHSSLGWLYWIDCPQGHDEELGYNSGMWVESGMKQEITFFRLFVLIYSLERIRNVWRGFTSFYLFSIFFTLEPILSIVTNQAKQEIYKCCPQMLVSCAEF